ncbi:MAG: zinc ribbon domain-containing protein [Patescibacteria group bacterium]
MAEKKSAVLCQSCGMAMYDAENFGTDAQGNRVSDYCRDCFRNGGFVEPELTMEVMIQRLSEGMFRSEQEPSIRDSIVNFIGSLERWHGELWTPPPSTISVVEDNEETPGGLSSSFSPR